MKRSWMVSLATATLVAALLAAPASAAEPDPPPIAQDKDRFDELTARYRQILQRRPRRGTAFDLWYRHYFDAGRLDDLLASVEDAAREQPDDSAAQLLLALVLERQGRDDEALAAYAAAEKLAPDDYYPPYARGTLLARRNEFDAAAEALARALELKPPRTEALDIAKALGRVHFRRGKTEEALRTWSDVAAQYPRDRQVLEELAALLAQEEQYDEAIRRCEQVAALVQGDPAGRLRAQIEIAQLHVEKEARKTAVELFARALADLKPESWQAQDIRRRIEDAFLRDEDIAGLVAWCQQQVESRPEDLEALRQLARAQVLAGRRDQALQTYERAVRLAPSHKDLRQALIDELVRKGEFAQAVTHGEELAKQHPADAGVLRRLGELHLEAAVPEQRSEAERKAVEVWKRIAAIRPDDPTLALQTAEACRRAARAQWVTKDKSSPLVQTADEFYREAIRRAAGAPHYHEYLGEFLHEHDRKDEAIQAWASIAAPPNDTAENCHRLSEVYARFGHLDQALEASRRSLAIDPQNFRYVNDRIGLLLEANQFDEALQLVTDLQKLADDPVREEQAQARVVEVYAAAGRLADKVAELRRRLGAADGTTEDRLLLALLLMEQRAFAAARDELSTALRSAPDDVRLLRLHAQLLQDLDDGPGAVEAYRRLVELDLLRRAKHCEQIVQIEMDLGRSDEAKAAADRLIELSPFSLDAYRLRARVAFQTNDPANALTALRRAVQIAPRDLGIRIELARALAEHQRQQEAIEHYWRCFELAESLDAKRSVVAAMTDLPAAVLPRDELIAALEQLRHRSENAKVLTLCLVEVHHRLSAYNAARRELMKLLDERRDDLDALRHLVELSELQQNWREAVSWQERIVTFTSKEEDLQKLARLHDRNGDPQSAAETWIRLLRHTGDDTLLVEEIDRRLAAGEFSLALALVEHGLKEAPDSWLLHHRAGCACYGLQEWDGAVKQFERVLTLTVGLEQPSNPVQELRAASEARSRFQRLHQFRLLLTRPRTGRTRPAAAQASGPVWLGNAFEARLDSVEALYTLSGRRGGPEVWIQEQQSSSTAAVSTRDLILVLYAAGALAAAPEIAQDFSEQFPDDPLPHVARLRQPVDPRTAVQQSPLERAGRRDDLQASFGWICEHRPDLKTEILFTYGTQLNALGYAESTAKRLIEELHALERPQDLGPLAELARLTYSPGFRSRFVVRASELMRSSGESAPEAALRALLEASIAPGMIAASEVDQDVADAAIVLFENYLRVRPAAAPGAQAPGVARSGRNLVVGFSNPPMIGPTGSHLQRARVLLNQYRTQEAMLAQKHSRATGRDAPPRIEEFRKSVLQQLESLGFGGSPDDLVQPFPSPVPDLDSDRFLALYRLHLWLKEAGQLDALLERLDQLPETDGPERRGRQMARAFVLWWSDSQEAALDCLRHACESARGDVELQLTLARAYSARSKPHKAMDVLRGIVDPPVSAADEISRLMSETARLAVLRGHEHIVRAVAWAPDGKTLGSGGYDGTFRLWNLDHTPSSEIHRQHEVVFCVAYSPDGMQLASAGLDGRIHLWDATAAPAAGGARMLIETFVGHEGVVRSLDFSPDGRLLLSAGDDGTLRLWDVAARAEKRRLGAHPDRILCAAFSPDGKSVAAAAGDRFIHLCDVASGRMTQRFRGHNSLIRAVTFSPDGKLLAAGGDDNRVWLWEVATGELQAELRGHADTVFDVAFSPDGSLLASAAGDRTIRLWNPQTDGAVATLTGHSDTVSSVRFSPDGRRLASASHDRTIRLWRIP